MRQLSAFTILTLLSTLVIQPNLTLGSEPDATDAAKRLLENLGVERGLIIHADDLGMGISINQGILSAWDQGAITSISLQTVKIVEPANGETIEYDPFTDAMNIISQRDDIDIGCHLTIHSTDGLKMRPVLPATEVPSLVDKDGFFKENRLYYLFASPDEIQAEMKAQIEKALHNNIKLTHIDCHLTWCHLFPTFKRIYASVAGEYGLPPRWPLHLFDKTKLNQNNVSVLNRTIRQLILLSRPSIKEVTDEIVQKRKAYLLKKLNRLPLGISEVTCHPALQGSSQAWRVVDYLVLTDSEVKAKIASMVASGELALIGHRQLKEVMDEQTTEKAPQPAGRKNYKISPFIVPGYTPELGFGITFGALHSFSTELENGDLPRSSINTALNIGFNGNCVVLAIANTYWLDDKLRVPFDIWFRDMPDRYYGVGYDSARNTPKGSDTTAYDRLWWQINPRFLWQFRQNLFAGLNLDFNQTVASKLSAGVAADPFMQEQGRRNYNDGAGLILMHDSRDMPVNAYSGWLLSGTATFYEEYLGSDNTYQIYEIDYRQYKQILRPGSILAWKIYTRFGKGDVPWPEMTQVGNPFNLRGYYWGQYRNVAGTYGILEYRFKFMTKGKNRLRPYIGRKESRHGFVVWGGLGMIGDDFDEQWGNWMPNAGAGYRFEVQPRMNIRLDIGVGYEAVGVYFNFNEAF